MARPRRLLQAAAISLAAALTTLVVYALRAFAHVEPPAEVAAALATVFGALITIATSRPAPAA